MDIAGYFNQHCVPIHFQFVNDDKDTKNFIVSAFIISIDDNWLLITAGHCLTEIENIKNNGYQLIKTRLVDYSGTQSLFTMPVPFDFESSPKITLDKNKYDYGVIFLDKNYRNLLQANKIKPFDETVWDKQPVNPDFYFLLGVPSELTEQNNGHIIIKPTFHPVTENEDVRKAFEANDAPTFYGEIRTENYGLKSIQGMSGGPLLSFKKTSEGGLKYWLHAVQSRWLPDKKYIAACKIKPLAEAIRELLH